MTNGRPIKAGMTYTAGAAQPVIHDQPQGPREPLSVTLANIRRLRSDVELGQLYDLARAPVQGNC